MSTELTPLLTAAVIFGWGGGIVFSAIAIFLSIRQRRLHPLEGIFELPQFLAQPTHLGHQCAPSKLSR